MRPSLEELMQAVGCEKYPARWGDIFDTVMGDFEQKGCPLTDPAYYDALGETYDILTRHRDLYKKAAAAVGENNALSRLLALLVAALADREHIKADLKEFSAPKTPDGTPDLAVDMLTGLAICSLVPYQYEVLKGRSLPDDFIRETLRLPENGVDEYAKRHGGVPGYHLLDWFQRAIEGKLFRIGRLEIEIFARFGGRAQIFENKQGEHIALAHDIVLHQSGRALGSKGCEDESRSWHAEVRENDTAWAGYPYDGSGLVQKNTVTLPKSQWKKVLEHGDPAVSLHIPPDGRLDTEAVDRTLQATKDFLKTYYPEWAYRAFVCCSWLLDPQLGDLLGAGSNIAKFGKRFHPLTNKSRGNDVFGFVFLKPDLNFSLSDLPEDTRLTRALKAHYLAGKAIYETQGYFF